LFVEKFEGHEHGDEEAWEAHIKIEIRSEDGERPGAAVVVVAWRGPDGGSVSLEANKDGNIDERIGPFSTPTVELTITRVVLEGYVYRPDLNAVPSSIVVEGPS
jgi:hypothetical protein